MKEITLLLLAIFQLTMYAVIAYSSVSFVTIAIHCFVEHVSIEKSVNWWINSCLYYIKAHFQHGAVSLETVTQVYYPVMQNIVYELLLANYALFHAAKPTSVSSVLASGSRISETANGYVYNYEILLTTTTNLLDEMQAAEILQKELFKKSFDGFPGVTFCNGYPIICVHEVLYANNYMLIRLIVLWNDNDQQRYNAYLEQKRQKQSFNIEDDFF